VPDVLVTIGNDAPDKGLSRSRVSINFEDAGSYNIGFESEQDVMFWWSRGAFFAKEVIVASWEVVARYHLTKTSPFHDVFPKIIAAASALSHGPSLNPIQAGENLTRLATGAPYDKAYLAEVADTVSFVTEGVTLTRANLYAYRTPNVMLSSVQNFHSGQLSFQAQFCEATLSLGASVWTTYPAAGDPAGLSGSHDGPNWWTGSATLPRVIQVNNAAIIAYDPGDAQFLLFGHRTHAWFPKHAFDPGSVVQSTGTVRMSDVFDTSSASAAMWTFGKVGDGYVGLFSAQAPTWTTSGPWADKELIADGFRNVFIIQIGDAGQYGSYESFIHQVTAARIHLRGVPLVTPREAAGGLGGAATGGAIGAGAGSVFGPVGTVGGFIVGAAIGGFLGAKASKDPLECEYDVPGGQRLELHYDDNAVFYGGKQLSDDRYPRFEDPYVKCDRVAWDQCFYTIEHGTHSLTHDFRGITDAARPDAVVRRLLDAASSDEYDCSQGPRPFYILGHNTNTIADVIAALDVGANAIESDVNTYEDHPDQLCIGESGAIDTDEGADSKAPSLTQYLQDLHGVAVNRPELALVVFDCKRNAATPEFGATLLQQIRKELTHDTNLNVIISVGEFGYQSIFQIIRGQLQAREGVMIDGENDPLAVSDFFTSAGAVNQGYGNGSTFTSPTLSPHIRPSIEEACALRAEAERIKFIYTWTLGDADGMREYIRIGADGIIAGGHSSSFEADPVALLRSVVDEDEFDSLIRLAKREDNPFQPPDNAYALTVHTGDKHNAGTDAMLTFTLTGKLGSSSKTVDASLIGSIFGKTPGRMERNAWDYVTLQSADLGDLKSITVQRTDDGNAPDWFLDRILIRSARYHASKDAVFEQWIETSPTTLTL
jgi:hypothetical protein